MKQRRLTVAHESWPIAGAFTISRGSKTTAEVVTVTLEQDGAVGRGECVPYPRYHETIPQVLEAIEAARVAIEAGAGRDQVAALVGPHAARNALDCALWDLEAKLSGRRAWELAGLTEPQPLVTCYTLSLAAPDAMAEAAAAASSRPLLKLKLGAPGDVERLEKIRKAAPDSRLVIDANEGWKPEDLPNLLAACAAVGVELVEQPLPAGNDEALRTLARSVPVCADESAHDRAGLSGLTGKYDAINIKLDKTGGLTEALLLAEDARRAGFGVMVGCMLATSLAMAPAVLVAQGALITDLDGPLLLARDREPGLRFEGSILYPPEPSLWG